LERSQIRNANLLNEVSIVGSFNTPLTMHSFEVSQRQRLYRPTSNLSRDGSSLVRIERKVNNSDYDLCIEKKMIGSTGLIIAWAL